MRNSQIAKIIVLTCMLAVGIFSAVIIFKTLRPSPGKPYEKLDVEQTIEYLAYEENYIFCDVSSAEEFDMIHIKHAVNMPYELLGSIAIREIPDLQQQIYVYARDRKTADKAATKLCELGYMNVTNVGVLADWLKYEDMIAQVS